jgi:hypothetical protein
MDSVFGSVVKRIGLGILILFAISTIFFMRVECQRIVSDEGATPVPAFALQLSAASSKLGFENPAANWEFDGFRMPERWWFV